MLACASLSAQPVSSQNLVWVDSFIQVVRHDPALSASRKDFLADSAYRIARQAGDICRQSHLRNIIALNLDDQGFSDSALQILLLSLKNWTPGCDTQVLLSCYNGLAYVYLSLSDPARADSSARLGLALIGASRQHINVRLALLSQQAIAKASMDSLDIAYRIFRQVLREAEATGEEQMVSRALNNLGTIKGMADDPDSAYHYFSLAAIRPDVRKDNSNLMPLLINMAYLDIERGRYGRAKLLLDSVYDIAERTNNLQMMANVQTNRSFLYEKQGDFRRAYEYLSEYSALREKILDEERVRSVSDMMEKYQSELKESQIKQLELEKLDATLKNERVTSTRNRIMFFGILLLAFAIGLLARLRHIRRSREAIQRERDVADNLLLNILPSSVAQELKAKGLTEARQYDNATILFSDFKDFTETSEDLSPAELVREVDTCFKAFDEIMTRYGLEKIKTIGDSYMAGAGIEGISAATAADAIRAALAMQRFIEERAEARRREGVPYFRMRAGINSGPVVGGIVGVKKFQYDLWGDTVNTASRMENHGDVGRVNISQSTYTLVETQPGFTFEPRGAIEVKGKGMLRMYFVAEGAGGGL